MTLHAPPSAAALDKTTLTARVRAALQALDAVLVAHYYVDGDLQDLADALSLIHI